MQIKAIDEKIDKQSKTSDLILSNIKSGNTSLIQVHSITIDIKNILGLFQSYILMQQSTLRGLGTGWQQDPVILEDALGFRIPIPLDLVNSWDMLDMILLKRFEKRSGHQKVLKGEYVIEEGITGRDVSRENELIMCLRPGQKIDMSMIFSDLDGNSSRCPRCFTKLEDSSEARTQW
ncbi:hypothetical protein DL95DRAFT_415047 [Leptodontidium sp. 2 PMI_412]|nr:hypothetical protein DL95DRAFT_415047 [Leptodontidium sp. 2 PMI_412]